MKYLTKEWKRESDLRERCMVKMLKRGIFSFAKWGKVLEEVAETALAESKAASGETGLAEELDDLLYSDVFAIDVTENHMRISIHDAVIAVDDCEIVEHDKFEIGDEKPVLYASELYALDGGKHELHLLIGDKDDGKPIEYYCVTVAGHLSFEKKSS